MTHHQCTKCGEDIAYDIDVYTLFCNACLTGAVRNIDDRNARLAAGDPTVTNMTAEERENVLDIRKRQRTGGS